MGKELLSHLKCRRILLIEKKTYKEEERILMPMGIVSSVVDQVDMTTLLIRVMPMIIMAFHDCSVP